MNIAELYHDIVAVRIDKQAEKTGGGIELMPGARTTDYHTATVIEVGQGHLVPALGWVKLPFKKGDKVIVQLGATILATIKSGLVDAEPTYLTKAASVLAKIAD